MTWRKREIETMKQASHVDGNDTFLACVDKVGEKRHEPVAWISTGPARMIHWTSDKPAYGDDWVALYATPPANDTRALKHRIHELEGELLGYKKIVANQDAMLERQTARIVELQEHIENFDGEDR